MRSKLSREEKETLYCSRMIELQVRWGNRLDFGDWEFVKKWNDEELDRNLAETIGQLKFEKGLSAAKQIARIVVIVFVALGVIGLLLFGIKQLLQILR